MPRTKSRRDIAFTCRVRMCGPSDRWRCRRCRRDHRNATRAASRRSADVARHEAHRIVDAVDRERREHGGVRAACDREVEILEGLARRWARDAGPGLDAAARGRSPSAIAFATSSAQTWTTRWRTVFATRSHSPVVPAAKITSARSRPGSRSERRALLVLDQPALVEHGDHGHREPRARMRLLDRAFTRGEGASERLEEVGHLHLKGRRELVERRHRRGALAQLDLRDQAHRKTRAVGELLERQPAPSCGCSRSRPPTTWLSRVSRSTSRPFSRIAASITARSSSISKGFCR